MPSNRIVYSFEGNTSGLRSAVNSAISELNKYARAIKGIGSSTNVGTAMNTTARSLEKMRTQLAGISAQFKTFNHKNGIPAFSKEFEKSARMVDDLVDSLKGIETARVGDMSALTDMQGKLSGISELMDSMSSETKMSYRSLEDYTSKLKDMNVGLEESVGAFNKSMSGAVAWRQRVDQIKLEIAHVKAMFQVMFKPFTQAATNFMQNSDNKVVRSLRSMIQKAKEASTAIKGFSGSDSSGFNRMKQAVADTNAELKRSVYYAQNYSAVQREWIKQQRQYENYLAKRDAAEARNQKYRGKSIEAPDLTKIIDSMMSGGSGGSGAEGSASAMLQFAGMLGRAKGQLSSVASILRGVFQGAMKVGRTATDIATRSLNTFGQVAKSLAISAADAAKSITEVAVQSNVAVVGVKGLVGTLKGLPAILKVLVSQILQISTADFLATATQGAIEYVENLNLFTVSMGEAIEKAQKFIDVMSEIYGMNPSNLMRYAGYFAQITGAIGLTDEAASKLSLSMTKMSNDIASLYNIEISQVVENLGSGLQGLNQAIRKYGMDMRQTTIQQTAYRYGLTENVATMSEANRVVLRYITMVEQMRNAIRQQTEDVNGATKVMGDFARNIETPANQLRILKEQFQMLANAIGTIFIPAVSALLPVLNGLIAAIRTIITFFTTLFGISIEDWGGTVSTGIGSAAGALDDLGDSASGAAGKMKDLVAPFDELNILSADLGSGGGGSALDNWGQLDPKLLKALEDLELSLDKVRMKAWDVRDAILEFFGLTPNGELIVDGYIDSIIKALDAGQYTRVGHIIADMFNKGIDWALENITWSKLGDDITNTIHELAGIFNGFVAEFDWYGLGNIGANIVNTIFHSIQEAIARTNWAMLGKQMSQSINGFAFNIEWDTVFETIAEGFNASFEWLIGFTAGLKYDEISKKFFTGLQKGFGKFQPELFGEAAANIIKGLITAVENAVEILDLTNLIIKFHAAIQRMVSEVANRTGDGNGWYDFGVAFGKLIGKAISYLVDFVVGMNDTGLTNAFFSFIKGTIEGINPEDLKADIQKIVNSIIGLFTKLTAEFPPEETFRVLYKWLKELIQGIKFTELTDDIAAWVNGFFKAFNDGMREDRQNGKQTLLDSLFNIIKDLLDKFDWFQIGTAIGDFITTFIAKMVAVISEPSKWGGFILGIANGIVQGLSGKEGQDLLEILGAGLVLIIMGVPAIIALPLAALGKGIVDGIADGISNAWNDFTNWMFTKLSDFFNNIGDKVDIVLPSLGKKFHELADSCMKNVTQGVTDGTPGLVNATENSMQEWIDQVYLKTGQLDEGFNQRMIDIGNDVRIRSQEIGTNLQAGISDGLISIRNLPWQLTGTESIQLLRSGLSAETVQLLADLGYTKDQMILVMTQALTDPAYATGLNYLTSTFANSFNNISQNASGMALRVNDAFRQASNSLSGLDSMTRNAQWMVNDLYQLADEARRANNEILDYSSYNNRYDFNLPTRFATGGVVTGPTRALIGEAGRSEAVIPLDNSPQMNRLVETIADAVHSPLNGNGGSTQPVEVHVYIGDREWDAFTYQSAKRGEKLTGASPVEVTT